MEGELYLLPGNVISLDGKVCVRVGADDEGKLLTTDSGPALGFGKYRGRLLKDIARLDGAYLICIICDGDFSDQVKQVVREAVKP